MLGLIAYDTDLCRPACVLVAAGMGAGVEMSKRFKTELWLLAPTPAMRVMPVEHEKQLQDLINITEAKNMDLLSDADVNRLFERMGIERPAA